MSGIKRGLRPALFITFNGDNADRRYAGHTFSLFPCKWSPKKNAWVRCSWKKAERLGIYSTFDGSVNPFFRNPEDAGVITTGFVKE